jgi:competence protein ComEC
MRSFPVLFATLITLAGPAAAARNTLDVYFVDVEGGQATLFVTPAGESLLVDAGWPGFEGRDAIRIQDAMKRAGIKQIDYFWMTHYHRDHVGGAAELAARVPVKTWVDHGDNVESGKGADEMNEIYRKAMATGKRLTLKPGDKLPIKGVDVITVAGHGQRITKALPGGGQANALCASAEQRKPDPSENAQSLGFVMTFGKFKIVDLGDLTWNKELELACPSNLLGKVDVYLTTHHGMDASGPAQIVHALAPRVAIMNNGAKKGGAPPAWQVVRSSPGLEDLWQVHYALGGGPENNTQADLIANQEENCQGHGLMLSANKNGSFEVVNLRNNFKKAYKAK